VRRLLPALLRPVLLSLALLGAVLSAPVHAQAVGDPAPEFALLNGEGDLRRLSDFKGRPLLLNVWATWCPPCQEELPLLQRVADEVGEDALKVLLVNNNEGRERATSFLEASGVTLETLVDATREERGRFSDEGVQLDTTLGVLRRLRVRGMPTSVLVGANGIIRRVWVGLITPDTAAELLAEVGVVWAP
jgi:cytochrome c biogenesis protein CcmG, thiol:disulfide interchange protein DsbE